MIIEFSKDSNATPDIAMSYPDQFLKESEKLDNKSWIKQTADYFTNIAYVQYNHNRKHVTKNYDLVKGIVTPEDFYEEGPEMKSWTDTLINNRELPKFVQSYSIMTSPINELVGELVRRPDTHRFKAFDDDSKNEELQFRTNLMQQYVKQKIQQEVATSIQLNPPDPSQDQQNPSGQQLTPQQQEEQEIQQLTIEKMKDYMVSYTSEAEKWANETLEACKAEFSMREKAEEIFRDNLLVAKEYMHVYEDTSRTGFNVDACNPKTVWKLTTPDKKYTRDAYAAGLVDVMEISEIIEKVPDLSKEEIDHLRKTSKIQGTLIGRSNYGSTASGTSTVKYDTYNRAVYQERLVSESELELDNRDLMTELFGRNVSLSSYGEKFVVVRGYFKSKKLIKKVDYIDDDNIQQTLLTDEYYEDGSIPTEISVEEGWATQWYKFMKIGSDVYKMAPFKLLDYCPIIGVDVEIKNTKAKSVVDMMKPFQALYNLCMNQLWEILKKEKGVVLNISIRKIPVPKDGDAQDALEIWEEEAREKGIIFEDDSPENMKAPSSSTNARSAAIDLSRSSEIQSRYELAARLKMECWDLIGMSRQRLGNVQATETATATNTAVTQSYAQTEPIYAQHEYLMDQVYQAIIDAAQYIESNKPSSTLSYINTVGESVFLEMTPGELRAKNLKLFSTSRPQDQQNFNELRALAQPMLQNGASVYDIVTLYTTNSIRQMKQVFKTLKDAQEEFQQNDQAMKQQELDQQQQQHEAEMQQLEQDKAIDREDANYNKAEDRLNKLEVASIIASSKTGGVPADNNNDGVADALEVSRLGLEEQSIKRDHDIKLAEIFQKDSQHAEQMDLERQRILEERRRTKSEHEIKLKELAVKKMQIKAKPKPSAKKKK